jgi:hypothetical protein
VKNIIHKNFFTELNLENFGFTIGEYESAVGGIYQKLIGRIEC